MLHVYLDETGTHDQSRLTMIAGLIATPEQWIAMSIEWKRALGKLQFFHASHCEAFKGIFSRLNDRTKDALFKNLADIIVSHTQRGVFTAIWREQWDRFKNKPLFVAFRNPYEMCFLYCVESIAQWPQYQGVDEQMQCTFGTQREYQKRAEGVYDAIKRVSPREGFLASNVRFLVANNTPALQAADLFAYELYKAPIAKTRPANYVWRPAMQSFIDAQFEFVGAQLRLDELNLQATVDHFVSNPYPKDEGIIVLPALDRWD